MARRDEEEGGTLTATAPTAAQFRAYRAMFEHFNRELFGSALTEPLLNLSRASKKTVAFFAPDRWETETGTTAHEISLNPAYLGRGTARETAQSFVHELVHLWQQQCGTPSRRGYHNTEWARRMIEVGLQPINAKTGLPAMSGQGMSDRILEGGAFEIAFATLPPEALLPWSSLEARAPSGGGPDVDAGGADEGDQEPAPTTKNKMKYTCPTCLTRVWGKPGLTLACLGGKEQHAPTLIVPASEGGHGGTGSRGDLPDGERSPRRGGLDEARDDDV